MKKYIWILQEYNDITDLSVFATKSAAKYYAENYYQSKKWNKISKDTMDLLYKDYNNITMEYEWNVICTITKNIIRR